ncbi:zinc finger BED domain-containing protein 5-like [Tachypleus tridentatus]|uniref:zinc finger BED domain-containing protein 5-like n=1 Tax=Tachypleus tridentatus TaxID=6853 RepID=UPI003FD62C85
MLPSKLKRHLISKHPNLADKTKEYFQRLKESTSKQARIFERKFNISKKANQASFAVAEIVAKQMKPHTIAESLILPACVTIAKIFFGDAAAEEIKNIPLSDNTIGRRITDMSVDIEKGVMLKLKAADFFAIQVDESTDLSGKSQLLAFIRFIENDGIVEDFLCCRELPETTKGQDIYDALSSYLNHWDLTWEKCVGICTDGCPSMIASVKGFVTLVKQSQPNIFITHCFLHREALVAKAIGPELKEVLDMVVKMVNYLKSKPVKCRQFTKLCESMDAEHVTLLFHTEVRWLSRGRVLSRFYELREELMIFFTSNNIEYVKFLSDESWCLKLAYLSDIFQHLNNLNMSMQGKRRTF